MIFKVEKINLTSDQWANRIENSPVSDIYLTPQYVYATRLISKGEPYIASLMQDDNNFVYYPFYLQEISLQHSSSTQLYDIVSPYGYSGPLINGDSNLASQFFDKFSQWCKENHVITEFIRYNPFLKNHSPAHASTTVELRNKIIYVKLNRPIEEIKNGFCSQHKRNLKKAIKGGLTFSEIDAEKHLDEFIQMYYHTMEKVDAKTLYFFSKEYFDTLYAVLKEHFHLFAVYHDDNIIAMAICLSLKDKIHYHLGASRQDHLTMRPNNLLFPEIMRWSQEHGFGLFNLGGGLSMDDPLFQFKNGFSKTEGEFYCGKTIFNPEVYDQLNELKRQEKGLSSEEFYSSTFFPLYNT